jgi:hypothetical protein
MQSSNTRSMPSSAMTQVPAGVLPPQVESFTVTCPKPSHNQRLVCDKLDAILYAFARSRSLYEAANP